MPMSPAAKRDRALNVGDLRAAIEGLTDDVLVVVSCEHESSVRFAHLVRRESVGYQFVKYAGHMLTLGPSDDQVIDLMVPRRGDDR